MGYPRLTREQAIATALHQPRERGQVNTYKSSNTLLLISRTSYKLERVKNKKRIYNILLLPSNLN